MSVVAGLDVGTQSVKLLVYDAASRTVLAEGSHALDLVAHEDGGREQQAQWWIDGIRACFSCIDPALRARVTAIGVSGQQHGFVPLDASGRVLAPVKLWCDTSTQRECEEIMQRAGGARHCIELAGNPVLAGYTASKLPWTARHRPDAYERLAAILLPHDYVNFWLTGQQWMECGDASGTGWLDVRRRTWSAEMLAATDPQRDLAACLPPLVEANAHFPIDPAIAAELELSKSVRVSAGGGDNMMAAIGTGNVMPGVLSMSLGTSGTLFTCASRPIVDPEGAWAAFCSSTGDWLPLICTMNCTVATGQVARAFDIAKGEGDELIAATRPGADGLGLLPFFNGERTPDLPQARATFYGMDVDNFTRANAYRAAMEGATHALRHGYDALCAAGLTFDAIRLTGGGSRSRAWRQMVADVFGLPVQVPRQAEGAAFGAALQALWACSGAGTSGSLETIAREHVALAEDQAALPDPSLRGAYDSAYREFQRQLSAAISLHSTRAGPLPACSPSATRTPP